MTRSRLLLATVIGSVLLVECGNPSMPMATRSSPTVSAQVASNEEIRQARLLDASSGWVLTVDRLLTTSDSGRTWANVTPPRSGKTTPLQTAFFLNPSQAWAIVRSSEIDVSADTVPLDVFSSTDGGRHWAGHHVAATIPLDTPGPVYLTFLDSLHGWLVVDQGSHSGVMRFTGYKTKDGGRSWTATAYPQSAPVLFIDQSNGFSAGITINNQSGVYVTHDGAGSWVRVMPEISIGSSAQFQMPTFKDARRGVLAGTATDRYGAPVGEAFYTSADAGQSWTTAANVPNPDSQTNAAMAAVMDTSDWLAGFLVAGSALGTSGTRLKVTHDGGRTWEWMPGVLPGAFNGDLTFAGSTGWGVLIQTGCRGFKSDCYTNFGLFQTRDAGATWERIAIA